MPSAQIQFTQSPITGTAGQSVLGLATGSAVTLTDAAGAGATSWAWSCVGFPAPLTSAPTITNSTSQVASLTPTVDGVYVIKLVRTDPGPVVTTDVRFFAIGDADYGYVLPSAGMTGRMTNIGGSTDAQNAGWEGTAAASPTSTNVFLDALLRFLRSTAGRFYGQQTTVNFSSASPTTVTVVDGTDKPFRILNLTGSGLYTSQLAKTAPVPVTGKVFRYKVALTAGSGGFTLLSGVAGTTILTLTAPPSGTTTYMVTAVFDGTDWFVSEVGTTNPLALMRSREFVAVGGLQTTNLTTATRIGSVRIDPTKLPSNAQITFQVAVDTTSPQVTVQLYNLTDSGIVSGSVLTSTSTTTTVLTSSALTLPSAQKDYEVQMFMASGGPTDHVDCTSARVIFTWG